MRVLGVDSSLSNTGIWCGDFADTFTPDAVRPSWEPDPTGWHFHRAFTNVSRGLFQTHPGEPVFSRLWAIAAWVHGAVSHHRPDIFALEAALVSGMNKSPTLYALVAVILDGLRDNARGPVQPLPKMVVLLEPHRLQKLAHGVAVTPSVKAKAKREGKATIVTPEVVVDRYREATCDMSTDPTDHEADAFFVAYWATRFWASITGRLPPEALLERERQTFFASHYTNAYKRERPSAIRDLGGHLWWVNKGVNPSPSHGS